MVREEAIAEQADGVSEKRYQAMMLREHGKAHDIGLHGPMEDCHGGLGPRRSQSKDIMWRWDRES